MQLSPYLHFNGQCETAFRFYERCLGGKIDALLKDGDAPMPEPVPENWRNAILHASLTVGEQVLLGSDSPPEYYHKPEGFYVSLSVDTPAEAARIFQLLAENGQVRMDLQKTFWSPSFGMLSDRFDIPWIINCTAAA